MGIYTPSKIEAPTTVPTPDFQESTPSAKPATNSAQKDETTNWSTLASKTAESNAEIYDPTKTINFSFKYPTEFYEIQSEDVMLVTNDSNYKLALKTPGKIAAWARISTPSLEIKSTTDSSLGGKKAFRKTGENFVLYHLSSLKTKEGIEVSFVFQCTYLPKQGYDLDKTCDLMASSFKFLE